MLIGSSSSDVRIIIFEHDINLQAVYLVWVTLIFNGLFLFIVVFSIQFLLQLMVNKICWWLDSNHGSLMVEGTILPTESQPLPN